MANNLRVHRPDNFGTRTAPTTAGSVVDELRGFCSAMGVPVEEYEAVTISKPIISR